jgi:branched-chain amino acid transport system substrate-binding protein
MGRPVKIGLIAPATGPFLAIGADMTQGFKLYLSTNENRLGRHEVELIVEDEGGTTNSARAAVESLLKEGVLAIAGVASPTSLTAMRDQIEKAKVPLVSANASPSVLTSVFYIWRASYVDGQAGAVLGGYAARRYPRVYLLSDETVSARAETAEFRKTFEDAQGRVVADVRSPGSFNSRLEDVRVSGADAVFCAYAGASAWALLEAYRDAHIPQVLLGPGSLTETRNLPRLITGGSRPISADILTAMNYASDLDNEANRRFVSDYHKANGVQPTSYAMAAYDSAAVLDKALLQLGDDPSSAQLNEAFSNLGQIDSPRGAWTFSITRTPQQKWYLRRLRLDGKVPANRVAVDLGMLS